MREAVKITGMGVVAPCGIGLESFFDGINSGVGTAKHLKYLEKEGLKNVIGCPVENFDAKEWIRPGIKISRYPRHTLLALAAAEMALKDSSISEKEWLQAGPVPVITGSTLNDPEHGATSVRRVSKMGPRGALPFSTFTYTPISISEMIASFIPAKSIISAVQNACCSGVDAICSGAELIASGKSKIAICGGADAPLFLHPMAEFTAARLTIPEFDDPSKAGKPFDTFRDVGVMAEGAGYVILESMDSPRPGYGVLKGYASGKDIGEFPGDGMTWVMEDALHNSRTRKETIDYISAWGPGHFILDLNEAEALEETFGDLLNNIPIASIKGAVGHALGASSIMQFISTTLSLHRGIIPPTTNLEFLDPDCSLLLSSKSRMLKPKVALVNSHGIGNNNSSLILTAN